MANELTYQSIFQGEQIDARLTAVASLQEALAAVEQAITAKYTKPASGIPETDLDAAVQSALAKARSAVQDLSNYYTKTEIDALLSAVNSQQYVDVTALPTASADTLGKIYLVGPDTNNQYARYYTSYDGSAYSWVAAGTTEINLANYATKAELSQLDQEVDEKSEVVDLLGTASGVSGTLDLSKYAQYDKVISGSSIWEAAAVANCYSRIIPVTPGKYRITAGSTQSIIAFLSAMPVDNQAVSFGTVNGAPTSSRTSITAGASQEFTILDTDTSAYLCVRDDASTVLKPTIVYAANVKLFVPLNTEFAVVTGETDNLVKLQDATVSLNGTTVETSYLGRIKITGTASANGGRTIKLCIPFTLPAGSYRMVFSTTPVAEIFVENVSGDAIIAQKSSPAFTLDSETAIYIGTNLVSGRIYSDVFGIAIFADQSKTEYIPTITAKDLTARKRGVSVENDITNIERLLDYKKSAPVFTVEQGNIYNGINNDSTEILRMANYFPVVGGMTLRLYHAQDIQIRVTEYQNPTATSAAFVKQTEYGAFEQVVLDANTKSIRISARYGDRGFDDSNPVSPSDYQSGDFGYYKQETALSGTLSTPRVFDYDDLSIFVDASTWKVSTSQQYRVKIIPVTGGGTIFCKAGNATTRIAFLNSFDEATIRSNSPVAVDGLGNQNTAAGTTRTYDIPQDCKFIALSSWYAGETLPDSLIIDGVEYMKTTQDNVTVLNQVVGQFDSVNQELAAIEQGSFTSIIGRNISRDAAVRATGKTAISSDTKPFSFIHVSDIHTKSNNFKCFKNACEFFQHYANIKAMIVTGDLVWDDFRDSMDYYNEAIEGTTKPILNIIGNHDAGQWHVDLSSVSTDKQCYDKFIAPYVSGWGVVQPENAASEGKSYYYKDFADEKVRLIVLCEFETDYQIDSSDSNKLLYSREFRAMRQAQVTWLIETLTSTPSDYGVVIALHQPLGELGQYDNEFVSFDLINRTNIFNVYAHTGDLEWLARIIDAFARKTSLSLSVEQTGAVVTTLDCSCDFSNVSSELICVLCGHTHQDYVGRLRNYPSIVILCVGADNLLYTSGFQPRAEGTPSEDLFNVVNIDRNRKTIKIIRIGSDASVTGQVRDQMLLNYGTL